MNHPHIKNMRVVSTVTYYLVDWPRGKRIAAGQAAPPTERRDQPAPYARATLNLVSNRP